MTTLADAKFDALRFLGFTGAVNDMTLQWLQAKAGVTANALPDAWREFLDTAVAGPTGQFNDDWYAYLGAQGHTGSLNDRELQFWIAQGPP